jgi:chromosome segregation ATPase
LTATISKMTEDQISKDKNKVKRQQLYSNLTNILGQICNEISSKEENLRKHVTEEIENLKQANLKEQQILKKNYIKFNGINVEINSLRNHVSENLLTIQDLKREIYEKNSQFNTDIQIKQSEIDGLKNLVMKLQLEISEYKIKSEKVDRPNLWN